MRYISTMTNFKRDCGVWVKAMRVPFFTATIIPIVLGSVAAWHDVSIFSWYKFWLALSGGILVHAATNMANDYFDHSSGCDEANPNPTPFSGGSRVIQEGVLPARSVLLGFTLCFILGGIIGLYLNYISGGNVILVLGIIGIFLALFYTAKPFRIGYGSFGELAVGIGFGPLMVMGSYYVQAKSLPIHVFLISIPVGMLIALVLYINEFPDYEGDALVGKRTLVVVLGKRNAVILYHALLALTYIVILTLAVFGFIPKTALIALLSIPLAIKAFLVSRENFAKIHELLPANAATIGLHSTIGILLILGFALAKIFTRG